MTDNPYWRDRAACRGQAQRGDDPWFPESPEETAKAHSSCRACPVARECTAFADLVRPEWGIWGGHDALRPSRAARTHCLQGHEYTPENTTVRTHSDGSQHRVCRECKRVADRKANQKKRQQRKREAAA